MHSYVKQKCKVVSLNLAHPVYFRHFFTDCRQFSEENIMFHVHLFRMFSRMPRGIEHILSRMSETIRRFVTRRSGGLSSVQKGHTVCPGF